MKLGILAIQGSVIEHSNILKKLNIKYSLVRSKEELESLTHLIIPGGESSTLIKLLHDFDIWDTLQDLVSKKQLSVFGTCAGAIICQKLGLGVTINRNGFGSQQSSFVDALESEKFPDLEGVFIRAPRFSDVGDEVEVLASWSGEPVLIRQDNLLVCSFHPELSDEMRIHEYFLTF